MSQAGCSSWGITESELIQTSNINVSKIIIGEYSTSELFDDLENISGTTLEEVLQPRG